MESLLAVQYAWLIPVLPLIGAAVAGFLGARCLKGRSHWPVWITVGASAALSLWLLASMARCLPPETPDIYDASGVPRQLTPASFYDMRATRRLFTWIRAGDFQADIGFLIDPLTAVMLSVVTVVGLLITLFSRGYMAGQPGYFRFFAHLGLFVFFMSILVMGDNFLALFLGWEGVGLCSYLLIGHEYARPAARDAARKAFIVNRVGDFAFTLGIMLIYVTFGTIRYLPAGPAPGVLDQAVLWSGRSDWSLACIPFLLMLGAFGKSAQFPLHVWLPDAMEGPTPVSALIHAATMVTAGVYMLVRCAPLFIANEPALYAVAAVGAFTALLAASIALRQFDMKRILAYSTISQLGFMFVGAAALAPVAAIFHLVTHAFFKALLFLAAGLVMHALAGQLDLRHMSGLKRLLPRTRAVMLIGCLALAGVIPFSGFWSKDAILLAAWNFNWFLGLVLLLTAFLTAYYTFRLYFRVFEGPLILPAAQPSMQVQHTPPPPAPSDWGGSSIRPGNAHEPLPMMLPLYVLATGAAFAGVLDVPMHWLGRFLGQSPSLEMALLTLALRPGSELSFDPSLFGKPVIRSMQAAATHNSLAVAGILVVLLGILVAYTLHRKDRPRADRLAQRFARPLAVLDARYWLDEIYHRALVEPLHRLGRAILDIDRYALDGLIWTLAFLPQVAGFVLKLTTQRGSLQGYALLMLLGIAIVLFFTLL